MSISLTEHHPFIQDIGKVIQSRANSPISTWHLAVLSYFLAQIPSSMRASVETPVGDTVPINVYSIALANSGYGKGHCINTIEQEVLSGFRNKYIEDVLDLVSSMSIENLALTRSTKYGTSEEEVRIALCKEINELGPYSFTFDSGTNPALKQLRQKLLLIRTGSLNLQMDELGSFLESNTDLLQVFLELYDKGNTNVKLIKETHTQKRHSKIDGSTPANMLLFGTPSKLFDGGSTEKLFNSLLETGYARRCLFGYAESHQDDASLPNSAEEFYNTLRMSGSNNSSDKWKNYLESFADVSYHNKTIRLPKDVAIALLGYRLECEKKALKLNEHHSIQISELKHRYFKALKLAGVFSFIDNKDEVGFTQLDQAIHLVEECGNSLYSILNRPAPYVRLAQYLSNVSDEQTQSDLSENLPFYKGNSYAKNELINLAIAWGYRNGILIKKQSVDGIDFFSAKKMKQTSLDELTVSYSTHLAYEYLTENISFDQLIQLVQTNDYHWSNHGFIGGNRKEANVIPGFNLLVLDVDNGTTVDFASEYLKEYQWIINYTKRHSPDYHRFRMILPLAQFHIMSEEEYKEFCNSIFDWLPFEVDPNSNQRSKKWLCSGNGVVVNQGKLLDTLQFIPRTKKGEEFRNNQTKIHSMSKLEKWIINNSGSGNRNNMLYRYAMSLKDSGMSLEEIEARILAVNAQLHEPLPKSELKHTILQSIKEQP